MKYKKLSLVISMFALIVASSAGISASNKYGQNMTKKEQLDRIDKIKKEKDGLEEKLKSTGQSKAVLGEMAREQALLEIETGTYDWKFDFELRLDGLEASYELNYREFNDPERSSFITEKDRKYNEKKIDTLKKLIDKYTHKVENESNIDYKKLDNALVKDFEEWKADMNDFAEEIFTQDEIEIYLMPELEFKQF